MHETSDAETFSHMDTIPTEKGKKMRLIDADALKERAIKVSTVKERCYMKAVGTMEIDRAPTIDDVPVVHGRWNFTDFVGEDWYSIKRAWECSNCRYQVESKDKNHIYPKHMKYCPNCGAKMDGDEK